MNSKRFKLLLIFSGSFILIYVLILISSSMLEEYCEPIPTIIRANLLALTPAFFIATVCVWLRISKLTRVVLLTIFMLTVPLFILAVLPIEGPHLWRKDVNVRFPPGFNANNWERVVPGMSESEVTRLIGAPHSKKTEDENNEWWSYSEESKDSHRSYWDGVMLGWHRWAITIENGRVKQKSVTPQCD